MFQKFLVPFLCCVALARGGVLSLQGIHGGQSVTSRSQDDHGNYAFNYDIVDENGAANGRQETGDAYGNKAGSYIIQDIDGRSRRVDYVADAHGFRATIGTNEPGTATSAVGDAVYHSSAPVLTAAPAKILAAAPAVLSHSYAAPLIQSYAAPAPLALAATKSYGALAAPLGYSSYGLGPAPLALSGGYGLSDLSGYGLGLSGHGSPIVQQLSAYRK